MANTDQDKAPEAQTSWAGSAWNWVSGKAGEAVTGAGNMVVSAKNAVTGTVNAFIDDPLHASVLADEAFVRGAVKFVPSLLGIGANAVNWASTHTTGYGYDGSAVQYLTGKIDSGFDAVEGAVGAGAYLQARTDNEKALKGTYEFGGNLATGGVEIKAGLGLLKAGASLFGIGTETAAVATTTAAVADSTASAIATTAAKAADDVVLTAPAATVQTAAPALATPAASAATNDAAWFARMGGKSPAVEIAEPALATPAATDTVVLPFKAPGLTAPAADAAPAGLEAVNAQLAEIRAHLQSLKEAAPAPSADAILPKAAATADAAADAGSATAKGASGAAKSESTGANTAENAQFTATDAPPPGGPPTPPQPKKLGWNQTYRMVHGLDKDKLDFRLNWLLEGGRAAQANRMVSKMLARGIKAEEHDVIADSVRLQATPEGRAIIQKVTEAYGQRAKTSGWNVTGQARNGQQTLMNGVSHIASTPGYVLSSPGYTTYSLTRGFVLPQTARTIVDSNIGFATAPLNLVRGTYNLGKAGVNAGSLRFIWGAEGAKAVTEPLTIGFSQLARGSRAGLTVAADEYLLDGKIRKDTLAVTGGALNLGTSAALNTAAAGLDAASHHTGGMASMALGYGADQARGLASTFTASSNPSADAPAGSSDPSASAAPSTVSGIWNKLSSGKGFWDNLGEKAEEHPLMALGGVLAAMNALGGGSVMEKGFYAIGIEMLMWGLEMLLGKDVSQNIGHALGAAFTDIKDGNFSKIGSDMSNAFGGASSGMNVLIAPGAALMRKQEAEWNRHPAPAAPAFN